MWIRTPCVTSMLSAALWQLWMLYLALVITVFIFVVLLHAATKFYPNEASYLVVYLCRLTVNNPVLIAWVHTSCMTQHSFPFPQRLWSPCATKLIILFWINMQKGQYSPRRMDGSKRVVVVRAVKTGILQNKKANVSLLQMNNMVEHVVAETKMKQ